MISRNLLSIAALAALLAGPALAAQEPASARAEPAAAASAPRAEAAVTTTHRTHVRHVRRIHRKAHGRRVAARKVVEQKTTRTMTPADAK